MNGAKERKNDEFYTKLEDVKECFELIKEQIKGKVIFSNCDDYHFSNYCKYAIENFKELGIKHFYSLDLHGNFLSYDGVSKKTDKFFNGSFDSIESIEILCKSDIVITNPPFSKLRDYISILKMYKKDFLIIAPNTSITHNIIHSQIVQGVLFNNKHKILFFNENSEVNCYHLSTFDIRVINHKRKLIELNNDLHIKFENYDILNVNSVNEIPDYDGLMAVPINFMSDYDYNKFEVLGVLNFKNFKKLFKETYTKDRDAYILENGIKKYTYKRIVIKKK